MSKRKRKPQYPADFVDWMTGYCEGFDDLSDGAWQSCCKTGVEDYNSSHGTHIDPHEGWLHWVNATSKESQTT